MTHYHAKVIDGKHVVGASTDGRDWVPIRAFDTPRQAIAFAAMRALDVQPLRQKVEAPSGR